MMLKASELGEPRPRITFVKVRHQSGLVLQEVMQKRMHLLSGSRVFEGLRCENTYVNISEDFGPGTFEYFSCIPL